MSGPNESSESSKLINDLFAINRHVVKGLWNMGTVYALPTNQSIRIVYPTYRSGIIRVSEKESIVLFIRALDTSEYYFAIEDPTEGIYGSGQRSALSDLGLYAVDGQRLRKVANTEFKKSIAKKGITKDIEKIIKEGLPGNWFQTLKSATSRTWKTLLGVFKESFNSFSEQFSAGKPISIVFTFCVISTRKAYLRHFLFDPTQGISLAEYANGFFDPMLLTNDTLWQSIDGAVSIKKSLQPEHLTAIVPDSYERVL